MTPSPPTLMLAAAAGLALGSYATTAGLRLARGEPSGLGRSHCDACGRTLSFAQTAPVISYVMARGACAACRARIDPIHPAGELAGAAVALTAACNPDPLRGTLVALLGFALLAAAAVDSKARRLPNVLTLVVAAAAAALAAERSLGALAAGAVAAAVAIVVLAAMRAAWSRLRGDPALGLGDLKLIAALALWLGAATPWMAAGASLVGLAAAAVLRPADRRLAFGPAIALAAWVTGLAVELGPWPTTV